MTFHALSQDYSQLPKVRTHAQLGRVGCSIFNPFNFCTPSDVAAAERELQEAHITLMNLVRATTDFYNDAQANGAPGDILASLGADSQAGYALVQQHSNLMSKFYAETGSGVAGLKGVKGGRGLGFLVLGLAIPELITLLAGALNSIAAYYLMNKLGNVMGEAAKAFAENAKVSQEKFKRDGQYYIAWKDSREKGLPPPPAPDLDSDGTDWTTIALIGGSVVIAVMLMGKR